MSLAHISEPEDRGGVLPPRSARPDGTGQLLAAARRITGPRAGRDSRLTPDGRGAEIAFVWPSPDTRLTVDPCPGAAPAHRAGRALGAMRTLGATLTDGQLAAVDRARSWQDRSETTRFGGWVGLRQRHGRLSGKLYMEVPEDADWRDWEARLLGRCPLLAARSARPTMLGLDPETGGIEIYYCSDTLAPAEIGSLCARAGLPDGTVCVGAFAAALTRRRLRHRLPSFDMGFSNALARDGEPLALTWYSTAVGMLGPDARAREALMRVGRARGWSMDEYAARTGGSVLPRHVLVGVALSHGAPRFTATVSIDLPAAGERRHG